MVKWLKYSPAPVAWYGKWLARSESTAYDAQKPDAAGLPRDMVFLSMIESGYATHAYVMRPRSASAFMAATAKDMISASTGGSTSAGTLSEPRTQPSST